MVHIITTYMTILSLKELGCCIFELKQQIITTCFAEVESQPIN